MFPVCPGAKISILLDTRRLLKLGLHEILTSRRLQICTLAVVVALLGDMAAALWPGIPRFWTQFLSDFDYVAIALGGATFGPKGGLITAAIAGVSHTTIQQFGFNRPLAAQGELTVFVLVGLLAGFCAERRSTASSEIRPGTDGSLDRFHQMQGPIQQLAPGLVHQLRTPLASIEGAVSVLEDCNLAYDQRRELVAILIKECRRLDLLIGLLDLDPSRRFEPTTVEIGSLLKEAVRRGMETPHHPGLSIESNTTPNLPRLHLDREAIVEAIADVLLNAIRAMPQGGRIVVSGHVLYDEVVIQVRDQRPSASATRIYRAMNSTPMASWPEVDLAIAQRILVRQGGALRIEQNVEAGITFTLILPRSTGAYA